MYNLSWGDEMTTKLYSASMIGKELELSKDYIHKLLQAGKIPTPLYQLGNMKGWSEKQFLSIKKELGR